MLLSPFLRLFCLYLLVEVLYELLVLVCPPLLQEDADGVDEVVSPVDCTEDEGSEEMVVVGMCSVFLYGWVCICRVVCLYYLWLGA